MVLLKKYFAWWSDNMLLWLPASFRGVAGEAPTLVLEPFDVAARDGAASGVHAALQSRRRRRDLGRFELNTGGIRSLGSALPERARPSIIVLRLPAAWLLEREVVLPLAAEQYVERVLRYELDRYTPFTSDEALWKFAIVQRDRAHEQLHLRLSLVTRAAVQPLLSTLSLAGVSPTFLEFASPEGLPCRIGLPRSRTRQESLGKYITFAAMTACALIAVAAAALPFIQQSLKLARATAQVQALQPQFAEAETLRRQLVANNAGADLITAEQARVGDVLTVLAAITDRLPDDTWLTDFSLQHGKLLVKGQSRTAARLISGLSGSRIIRYPEFAAPVTRLNDEQLDQFAIHAEIIP